MHPHRDSACGRRGDAAMKPPGVFMFLLPPDPLRPRRGLLGASRAPLKQPQLPFSANPYPNPVPCNRSLFLAGIWDGGQRRISYKTERYQ